MALFLFWVILAVLVGVYASRKGLSGAAYFFISLALSPAIGFLIAFAAKPNYEKIAESSNLKRCPRCAEYVREEATVCRYCGKSFPIEVGGIVLAE